MSFGADLKQFSDKATRAAEKTYRAICLELFSSVIMDTPVDTGRARNNWFCSVGSPSNETTEHGAPVGTATINRVRLALQGAPLTSTTYLTNNLPYIEKLEEGYSGQAPAGMVRKNVARIQRLVDEQVRKNKL